jgi:hypothetical protein
MATEGKSQLIIQLKRPYGMLALAGGLFGGAAAFFFHRASTNQRGLILNWFITLGPGGADIFYVCLGLLSSGFVLIAAWSTLKMMSIKEFRILVGKTSIKMPYSPLWRGSGQADIPIDRVISIGTSKLGLVVRGVDATYMIPARWIPGGWTVQQAAEEIATRVTQAREAAEKKEARAAKI